jgi:phospholipase/lecithinase/hemolysin
MAGQAHYDAIYVFGDSLSDTGNDFAAGTAQQMVPAVPPSVTPYATYWQGRFSNGPVAVEYLWKLIAGKNNAELTPSVLVGDIDKKTGVNFAFGGSASGVQNPLPNGVLVPGLVGQVGLYKAALRGKKPKSNALFVVWSGSNDYLQNLTNDPYVVLGNVTKSIRALYDTGARDFLVPNLPDMGGSPFVKAQGASAQFTLLAKTHNALLASSLNALGNLPGIKIIKVDVFAVGLTLANSGLVNADVPALAFLYPDTGAVDCLFRNPASCVDVVQTGFLASFLYWDVMHPTTQIHAVIGTAMYGALLKMLPQERQQGTGD